MDALGYIIIVILDALNGAVGAAMRTADTLMQRELARKTWAAVAQIATTTPLRGMALALTSASKDECCACIPVAHIGAGAWAARDLMASMKLARMLPLVVVTMPQLTTACGAALRGRRERRMKAALARCVAPLSRARSTSAALPVERKVHAGATRSGRRASSSAGGCGANSPCATASS